jgi:hypothetical protein
MALGDDSTPTTIRATRFGERSSTLSPDGRYLAYQSDESGRWEIYIQGLHDNVGRIQLSRSGGVRSRWGRNSELFFWRGSEVIAVPVRTTPQLEVGDPVVLFDFVRQTSSHSREFDVSADGQYFVLTRIPETSKPREIRVVLNWFTELERLAGQGGAQ